MNYEVFYGKKHKAKKSKSPVRKTTSSKKLHKKILDSMSLKKLKTLAKKYKVSCYKKGTKECVKKSTLLRRLKESRSINKILKSASAMKKRKHSTRFGMNTLAPNTPKLSTPLELALGQTYEGQRRHYNSIPTTLISQNFQGTGAGNFKNRMQLNSKNFKYTKGSLGRSSLPPYENINDLKQKFGRYFH